MPLLEWSSALALGVELIDEQHKSLIDTMNDLNDQILRGQNVTGCALALKRMQEYTVFHFTDEEALMLKSDFPRREAHMKVHSKFVQETDKFSVTDCESNPEKAMEVLTFLQDWLVDHILGPDLIFTRHYKAWEESR